MSNSFTYFVGVCATGVQPAPPNLSVSVKNESLLVTWGLPDSRTQIASCLEYELDLGDKVEEVCLLYMNYYRCLCFGAHTVPAGMIKKICAESSLQSLLLPN